MKTKWNITLQIARSGRNQKAHFDRFPMEVDPEEYVLDAVERVWAFHDRTLVYRHACHHSTCGACAMRVNGVEKLTCITPINQVTRDGGVMKVEPLRNFPVIADLAVDMGELFREMDSAEYPSVTPLEQAPLEDGIRPAGKEAEEGLFRLNDCIECGCCVSACPIELTQPEYLGPAVLAGIQFSGVKGMPHNEAEADAQNGVWRCHSAFECSAVCPSNVEPGWRIMDLRRQVIGRRLARLFSGKEQS